MIVVTSKDSGTSVELWCYLCRERLGLTSAWMAFPVNADGQEGRWVHERCAAGRIQSMFGTSRAVMMRGEAALSHLAASLHYTDEE